MLFTKKEYKERLIKVQSLMQEKGIELLISQDTNNTVSYTHLTLPTNREV